MLVKCSFLHSKDFCALSLALYIIFKNKCPTWKKKNIYVFMLEKLKHLKQVAAVVIVFILQEAEETTGNNAQLGMWA